MTRRERRVRADAGRGANFNLEVSALAVECGEAEVEFGVHEAARDRGVIDRERQADLIAERRVVPQREAQVGLTGVRRARERELTLVQELRSERLRARFGDEVGHRRDRDHGTGGQSDRAKKTRRRAIHGQPSVH